MADLPIIMNKHFQDFVLETMGAKAITSQEVIQSLWSGYGQIVRVGLAGATLKSVVVKYIQFPTESNHPRGWNTELSHTRKMNSYDIEMHWYRDWSSRCNKACRVAKCYAARGMADERIIILEDLDAAGFSVRKTDLDMAEVKLCLRWLANFHACFMNEKPSGLWQTGTYWHLETRPDEWASMVEGELKNAAADIDSLLNNGIYQTIVHGDAKVANFCFSPNNRDVSAVDFQYVGGGCGMKDVAYLLGSCLTESQCEMWQNELLIFYFAELKRALTMFDKQLDWQALEAEWRTMFPVAWTDFYRFLVGWMPSHKKINSYTQHLADQVLSTCNVSNQ